MKPIQLGRMRVHKVHEMDSPVPLLSQLPGTTADDLKRNDALRTSREAVPDRLGLGPVITWGARFGDAPEAYWKAFRQAALTLRLRRESATNSRVAARPTAPKPPGGPR